MCDHTTSSSKTRAAAEAAVETKHPSNVHPVQTAAGSRRRKLWELAVETHCPIIGVCLPMTTLRRLFAKGLGYEVSADDYEFHANAVGECGSRRPMSERIQRELELRYAPSVKRLSKIKTTVELASCWAEAVRNSAAAEMLWATLTHPQCDEHLRQQVCRDIHMFQHQAGAAARADINRLKELREENATLAAQLFQVRERRASDLAQRDAFIANLQSQLAQLRGRLAARENEADHLRGQLVALKKSIPDLAERTQLVEEREALKNTIQQLRQQQGREKENLEKESREKNSQERENRIEAAAAATAVTAIPVNDTEEAGTGQMLRDKAVLCVGGRGAAVPVYRQLIECSGAHFMHHDGGKEAASRQLDASLAAADLVICQTGCISHGAYWRVKEHCKRTGKQCVFVEKPSASSLARCLRDLAGAAVACENFRGQTLPGVAKRSE